MLALLLPEMGTHADGNSDEPSVIGFPESEGQENFLSRPGQPLGQAPYELPAKCP